MFSAGNPSFDYNDLLSKIDEFKLIYHYLGVSKIPCRINSPLRKDNNPSFGLYSNNGKRIYWIDYATKERGGIYDLLMRMWHLSFNEVLQRIVKDFPNLGTKADISYKRCYHSRNSITDLKVKVREWRDYDIKYWESYGISLSWLKYAEVYPISHKIIIKESDTFIMGADKYAYVYVEHKEGKVTLKIYQPFNKKYKWSNKHDRSVISLWTKVPKTGDKIVICSSLKDALCLWANTGIPALAVQGEGYSISQTAINQLKERYKLVYILFDNDKAGLEDGIKLAKETGFINLVLPPFPEGKDVSDYYKAHSDKFRETILNLFNYSL